MNERYHGGKKVYACPHCLYVIASGKLSPKVNRDDYLCDSCGDRVKIQIFDSQKEYEWFNKIWLLKTWNNETIFNVEHKKRYHFFNAIYYSISRKCLYEALKGKEAKGDILIKRKSSYEADIIVYTKKDGVTKEYVFDVKGSWMKPGDRVRFERNCQLMMAIYGLKVEVLR